MKPIPIYFGDAFTRDGNSPFTGNPGAICILEYDDDIPDETKQKIANEANLNATAFVSLDWARPQISENGGVSGETPINGNGLRRDPNGNENNAGKVLIKRKIRWFSPTREVPLCGHDTIIAVKVLEEILLGQEPDLLKRKEISVEFDSPFRGVLGATISCETGRITLNFPSSPGLPIHMNSVTWIDHLVEAVLSPKWTSTAIQDIQYSPSANVLMLRLADHLSPQDFREISPNFGKLKLLETFEGMIGLAVTLKGKNGGDVVKGQPHFYSRYFGPWVGFEEDPVCGSAYTVLAPYWLNEYKMTFGETLLGSYLSTRGGVIYSTMIDNERVSLGG